MNPSRLSAELDFLIRECGVYPYKFFNVLHHSENPNLDLTKQSEIWQDIKDEEWHDLKLENYSLWAITDNGDLLWWNEKQTIAMNPRAQEYMAFPVNPKQFIRLIGLGKVTGIFPSALWTHA
jgi:hypothetical protein